MRENRVRLRLVSLVVGLFTATGALLAAPPDPNSAADLFVPAIPGLVVSDFCMGSPCTLSGAPGNLSITPEARIKVDAAGWVYLDPAGGGYLGTTCDVTNGNPVNLQFRPFYRVSGGGPAQMVGAFHDTCESGYVREVEPIGVDIDPINGVLYVSVGNLTFDGQNFGGRAAIVKIEGLVPPLFDLFLSYQPPSTLSFNVPVRPEGLPGADSFSVYAGDARHASDLSQSLAMKCLVPTGRQPVSGELLTVPDTLPDPSPGESRYYLATVNYQGQRRAGRSAINGVLQGRNASVLPGCQ